MTHIALAEVQQAVVFYARLVGFVVVASCARSAVVAKSVQVAMPGDTGVVIAVLR